MTTSRTVCTFRGMCAVQRHDSAGAAEVDPLGRQPCRYGAREDPFSVGTVFTGDDYGVDSERMSQGFPGRLPDVTRVDGISRGRLPATIRRNAGSARGRRLLETAVSPAQRSASRPAT